MIHTVFINMWLSVNVLFTSYFIASLLLILPNFATASPNSNITYDYIVVGGGLTGLVVANRLTEDPTGLTRPSFGRLFSLKIH